MKKGFLLIIVLLITVLSGCQKKDDFTQDYPIMRGVEHVYEKVEYDDIINAFTVKSGVHVVLFAFDTDFAECPYCIACVPLLNEVAIEMGIAKILYIDIYRMRQERTAEYLLLLGYLDGKVGDLLEKNGKKEIVVPDVYVIKDGEIIGHHIATIKDDADKFIFNLSEEEKNQVRNIYRQLLTLSQN